MYKHIAKKTAVIVYSVLPLQHSLCLGKDNISSHRQNQQPSLTAVGSYSHCNSTRAGCLLQCCVCQLDVTALMTGCLIEPTKSSFMLGPGMARATDRNIS